MINRLLAVSLVVFLARECGGDKLLSAQMFVISTIHQSAFKRILFPIHHHWVVLAS